VQIHMGLLRRAAALELEDMGRLVSRTGRKDLAGVPDFQVGPEAKIKAGKDFVEG